MICCVACMRCTGRARHVYMMTHVVCTPYCVVGTTHTYTLDGHVTRLREALHNIRQKGVDPRGMDHPVVVDIDGSKPHWMLGMCPCLTRARASTGHYLPALGRRLTVPERLRLQALPVDTHACCEGNISDHQLGAMIGNLLSLNVVGAIVSQMLVACGLLEAGKRS